jgi:ribosome-binding ATPase YchF (GTP1/OBG family)
MATVDIVDIAGLVKGASKGEGLGNQFLEILENVMQLFMFCVVLIMIILFTLMEM